MAQGCAKYTARHLRFQSFVAAADEAHAFMTSAAEEESRALDRALNLDPNHLPALIRKGDLFARQGDEHAASGFYAAAIRVANSLPSLLPEWREELKRVAAAHQRMRTNFEAHLVSELTARGLGAAGTERVSRTLDLLLGKKQIFLQQPTNLYFPGLPQIEFYERREFRWVEALESHTQRIRSEVLAIINGVGWAPYIENEARRPAGANPLLQDPNWSAFYLIKDGKVVEPNARRCPETMAALRNLPLCRTGRTPAALFSLLRPGTRIRPHHGYMNARLICHLPLIIPGECALRVGNETRAWREGEVVVFDDSVEHEAWNLSKELRVVMIFDVWRPELTPIERTLIGVLLDAAIETGSGQEQAFKA
jgi:aspartyl/asparaginyl beta-hydroxylase (cupin superfamily)